jgi:hypothetical protein
VRRHEHVGPSARSRHQLLLTSSPPGLPDWNVVTPGR